MCGMYDTQKQIIKLKPRDIFEDSEWLHLLIGFTRKQDSRYHCYLFFLTTLYLTMLFFSIYQLFLVIEDLYYFVATLHFVACNVWVGLVLLAKHAADGSLKKMREMVRYGIYRYEEEELDAEQMRMQEEVSEDMRTEVNLFVSLYSAGFLCVTFLSPLLEFLFYRSEDRGLANPYLPHSFYVPFDTYSLMGFAAAYAMDLAFWLYSVVLIVCCFKLVFFGMVQLRLHLKILNHSLRNIGNRAMVLYLKKYGLDKELHSSEVLFKSKEFDRCLHLCLRANIQHHHVLLRFRKTCQQFYGIILIGMFTVLTVILYSCLIFLILQDIPLSSRLKYVCMFIGENLCSFMSCRFGEAVIEESGKLFESAYSGSWMDYSRDYQKSLLILMACTRLPIKFRTTILDGTACLEDYGKLTQASYTMMNVMVAT